MQSRIKSQNHYSDKAGVSVKNPFNAKNNSRISKQKYSKTSNTQNSNEPIIQFSPFQWNQPNQRLYPTMSDSAVCGYPIPMNIPIDPRYHTMYPMYQPYVPLGYGRDYLEQDSLTKSKDQFTSLPPINVIDNDSELKRTHSDPGLNNSDDKFELLSSGSDVESTETCFPNEIAELKQENCRLSNELEFLKIELRNLKLEISNKNNQNCACNDAGSLTSIIQEIRTAHILMEKTLESKLNQFCASLNENVIDKTKVSIIRERVKKFEDSNVLTNSIFQKDPQHDTNKLQKEIDNLHSKQSTLT